MLVLSRHKDDEIMITMPDGRLIRLRVCEVTYGRVRIGIEAPADVAIDRREIWEHKREHGHK